MSDAKEVMEAAQAGGTICPTLMLRKLQMVAQLHDGLGKSLTVLSPIDVSSGLAGNRHFWHIVGNWRRWAAWHDET
jgi:hypothetical protein